MTRRALTAALSAAALAACELAPAPMIDAGRFDAREVMLSPEDALDTGLALDVPLAVDVRVATDAGESGVAGGDGAASDASVACVALANEHAAAVREGRACVSDDDCEALVCETVCCACQVFARASRASVARELEERSQRAGCSASLGCPRVPCDPALRGRCSAEGLCVTIRGTAPDAGASDAAP